jgi:hypothetical protein
MAAGVSPSPAWAEWHFETLFLRYSGGTAPDFHRTSLLSPCGHLRTPNKYHRKAHGVKLGEPLARLRSLQTAHPGHSLLGDKARPYFPESP